MTEKRQNQQIQKQEEMKPAQPEAARQEYDEDEINEVVHSLRSGWLTTGPKTRRFEKDFSEFLGGRREALVVNSATAGLHLALEALGVGSGDEVITTTYTFTSSAEIIRYLGADPVFTDIIPETLNMDPSLVEKAITPRTKAIIPVHVAGLPCDMDPLLAIRDKYGIPIVEDAAHSFPSYYRGRMIGTLPTDIAVFSFYATKTITTGEGGMVVTADGDLAARCRIMRLHGIDRDAFDRYTSDKPAWYYEIVAPGFKYNMTDVAASIGIHQLKKAHEFKRKRRSISLRYLEAFKDLPVVLPKDGESPEDHAWHLFVLRLDEKRTTLTRDEFIGAMAREGIGCSVHFIPLHLQPYWRDTYRLTPEQFPAATAEYKKTVSLPIYTKMTDGDVERVICAVRKLLTA
jgi:dTDP-4-amino-4,6-dideoxygalactose transaminase